MTLLIYEDFRSRSSLPVRCLSAPPARQTGADTHRQARRQGMRKNNGSTERSTVRLSSRRSLTPKARRRPQ